MDAYTEFAKVYDLFMDNIPYEEWGAYLKGLLHENGVDDGLVLELGCGTGTMTEILAEAGCRKQPEREKNPDMRSCICVRI